MTPFRNGNGNGEPLSREWDDGNGGFENGGDPTDHPDPEYQDDDGEREDGVFTGGPTTYEPGDPGADPDPEPDNTVQFPMPDPPEDSAPAGGSAPGGAPAPGAQLQELAPWLLAGALFLLYRYAARRD